MEQTSWTSWEAEPWSLKQTDLWGGLGGELALGVKQELSYEIKNFIQQYDPRKKGFPVSDISESFVQMWGHHWGYKMLQVPAVVLAAVLLCWVLHALICFHFY